MKNGKNISVGTILWKVLRQPIASELTYEQASEFTIEYLRLIGAPLAYEDKVVNIEIIEHKGNLPDDLIDVRGIKYDNIALRYATNTFHLESSNECVTEYTYVLQNCKIITSMKEGIINLSYKAISTDSEGYPMIPDNESFKKGLEYYILHMYLEPLWSMGKIQDKVFQYYEQKRHFYAGQATNSINMGNMDLLESMMNSINRLIIQKNPRGTTYKNMGEPEIIKKYS